MSPIDGDSCNAQPRAGCLVLLGAEQLRVTDADSLMFFFTSLDVSCISGNCFSIPGLTEVGYLTLTPNSYN